MHRNHRLLEDMTKTYQAAQMLASDISELRAGADRASQMVLEDLYDSIRKAELKLYRLKSAWEDDNAEG